MVRTCWHNAVHDVNNSQSSEGKGLGPDLCYPDICCQEPINTASWEQTTHRSRVQRLKFHEFDTTQDNRHLLFLSVNIFKNLFYFELSSIVCIACTFLAFDALFGMHGALPHQCLKDNSLGSKWKLEEPSARTRNFPLLVLPRRAWDVSLSVFASLTSTLRVTSVGSGFLISFFGFGCLI